MIPQRMQLQEHLTGLLRSLHRRWHCRWRRLRLEGCSSRSRRGEVEGRSCKLQVQVEVDLGRVNIIQQIMWVNGIDRGVPRWDWQMLHACAYLHMKQRAQCLQILACAPQATAVEAATAVAAAEQLTSVALPCSCLSPASMQHTMVVDA
jgi:hypothetical protein